MKELGITKGEWRIDTADAIKIKAEDGSNIAILTHLTNFKRRDTDEVERNALLIADAGNTAQKCGLLPSELLQQRNELKEALAEQKRLYFSLFDEETSCMYCEAKIRLGSAIILCKECAENTEV